MFDRVRNICRRMILRRRPPVERKADALVRVTHALQTHRARPVIIHPTTYRVSVFELAELAELARRQMVVNPLIVIMLPTSILTGIYAGFDPGFLFMFATLLILSFLGPPFLFATLPYLLGRRELSKLGEINRFR